MLQVQIIDFLRAQAILRPATALQVGCAAATRRHATRLAATLPLVGAGVSGQTRGSEQRWTCGFLLPASARIVPTEDAGVSIPALREKVNPESILLLATANKNPVQL